MLTTLVIIAPISSGFQRLKMKLNKLACVKQAKYLGVIVCNDLRDDEDILRHLHNVYTKCNNIIRKCHHCSVGVKLHLFHAYRRTIYCSQL